MADDEIEQCEKRVRKSVQRLSEVFDKDFVAYKKDKMVFPEGNGIKLGDIERVKDAYHRNKIDKEIAKNIHVLCYKTPGQALKRNANIRRYNGFNSNDDKEFKRRISSCEKINVDHLKIICDLFNVPTTGKQKKEICTLLINFLQSPIETESKKFRTGALKRKNKSKVKSKGSAPKGKKILSIDNKMKKKEHDAQSESVSESSSENNSDTVEVESKPDVKRATDMKKVSSALLKNKEKDEDSDSLSDIDSEKIVTPSKMGIKKRKKINLVESNVKKLKKDLNNDKKTKIKNENVKSNSNILSEKNNEVKAANAPTPRKAVIENNLNSDDEKSKSVDNSKDDISDTVFVTVIQEILKDADLNTTTLNKVCDDVVDKFPEIDLVSKRQHIKQLVKKVIEEN